MKKGLSFRKAVLDDCRMYYEWRNDAVTRANSFSSDRISYESHEGWFKKHLSDANCQMYVLLFDGAPVGQIRFDREDGCAVISVSIASEMRGQSLGKKGIKMLSDRIIGDKYADKIVALIKAGNDASLKAFIASGYSVVDDKYMIKDEPAFKLEYKEQGSAK